MYDSWHETCLDSHLVESSIEDEPSVYFLKRDFDYSKKLIINSTPKFNYERYLIHFENLRLANWKHQSDGGLKMGTNLYDIFLSIRSESDRVPTWLVQANS